MRIMLIATLSGCIACATTRGTSERELQAVRNATNGDTYRGTIPALHALFDALEKDDAPQILQALTAMRFGAATAAAVQCPPTELKESIRISAIPGPRAMIVRASVICVIGPYTNATLHYGEESRAFDSVQFPEDPDATLSPSQLRTQYEDLLIADAAAWGNSGLRIPTEFATNIVLLLANYQEALEGKRTIMVEPSTSGFDIRTEHHFRFRLTRAKVIPTLEALGKLADDYHDANGVATPWEVMRLTEDAPYLLAVAFDLFPDSRALPQLAQDGVDFGRAALVRTGLGNLKNSVTSDAIQIPSFE
ncbi:hypothetical protein HYV74_01500 [Candidatus Uhrbacteria bacterium]|nr:hypothetical protein [Candidatus Uhrbacteria bacterium]